MNDFFGDWHVTHEIFFKIRYFLFKIKKRNKLINEDFLLGVKYHKIKLIKIITIYILYKRLCALNNFSNRM